jgi:putative heme-binding domain-containing protein
MIPFLREFRHNSSHRIMNAIPPIRKSHPALLSTTASPTIRVPESAPPRRVARGWEISWALTGLLCLGTTLIAAPIERPLELVSDPPAIHMLVPGFDVRELPVDLRNINNLVFAPDGRLFALGYDGYVYQLHDRNGDGVEESATLFHDDRDNEIPESIGMTWGRGRDGQGQGLYIASRGCVFFLLDRGDGMGELQTVTSGWDPPALKGGSSLDAVGIAVDDAGEIFFSLSVDAWREPYRINKETGRSDYNQFSERGTIIKLSSDWEQREIVCTGMRFTVSLAFNAAGDLFCSEQEGATWLPNGNPFDELLHIRKGRHYGFPPRHPKYLPGVIDEPSLFDYAPQHQSTCGLHFNEPVAGGGRIFGPAWWRGDAIVAGESRGKIWRTKLVKTPVGYVAQNSLIACLSMLTIDATPAPNGDLVVACHSGAPDWGTGPGGKGKLFRIRHVDDSAPQPTLAYAVSPTETRIVFDRSLNPAQVKQLTRRADISMGSHVAAADRFESMRPGYQVVKDQMKVERFQLPVLSSAITPDRREIVLTTEPRVQDLNYAIAILKSPGTNGLPDIDVLSDLNGVEALSAGESFWLPHLDLDVSRELTRESVRHQRFFKPSAGDKITLQTQLNLKQMLRPAIQPGSQLDHEYTPETVTLVFSSDQMLDVRSDGNAVRKGDTRVEVTTTPASGSWFPVRVELRAGAALNVHWYTAEDQRPRPFPLRRFKLPWAQPSSAQPVVSRERRIPEIAGGDWAKGKKLFFSEALACGKCHRIRDEGGDLGADLSNLVHRDYDSVLRDIMQPSAALNPDHLAYNITLKDGEELSGVVMAESRTQLILGQVTGGSLTVQKSRIKRQVASSISLMPEGLLETLNREDRRDLMAFLLMKPNSAKQE